MTPTQLKRVVELVAEIEEIMKVNTTFLNGPDGDDIVGILIADEATTNDVLGPIADTESMN